MSKSQMSPQKVVEILYGPWHGEQGILQESLSPQEWLVRLFREDQYGEVLLALEVCQFRSLG